MQEVSVRRTDPMYVYQQKYIFMMIDFAVIVQPF
jgi:hypothetical protein